MTIERDGRHDFDFLHGSWTIQHRRLRERLKGSTTWEEFESSTTVRPTLGGLGNMDETSMARESGRVEGMTVRFYHPATHEWSIYWADSVNGFGTTPMIGRFEDGRGVFFAQEAFEGRHIFVRFVWTNAGVDACRWEQAFSVDGGTTWEVNWIMEFTRLA